MIVRFKSSIHLRLALGLAAMLLPLIALAVTGLATGSRHAQSQTRALFYAIFFLAAGIMAALGILVFRSVSTAIRERQQAGHLLREQEAMLAQTQAIGHVGSWALDLVSSRLTWSDEVYRIFGLPPQAFLATYEAFLEFVHPADRAAVNAAYSNSVGEGKDSYEIEHRIIRIDTAEIRFVHEKGIHLRDEAGRIIKTVGMVQDITERKKAEEELEKRNQFIESLLENAPIGFAVHTISSGRPVFMSRNFERLYGLSPGSVHSVEDYFQKVYLDPVFREEMRERVLADMATGDIARMRWEDIPITTKAGEHRFITATNIPLVDQDLMISSVQDVTDRKRAEAAMELDHERLDLAVTATGLCLYDWNPKTGEVLFSDPWAAMLGYRVEELQPDISAWSERVHPDDLPITRNAFEDACREDGTPYICEYRLRHRDGSWRWILDKGRIVSRDAQGLVTRFVGANLEITDRKRAEAERVELESRNRQLQKAESLALMAGSIAHHFNNKLQAVMAHLELLGTLSKGDDPTKFLNLAKQATDKAAEVSQQMLVYLGQSSGEREPRFLAELCRDGLAVLRTALPSTVALEVDFPSPGPVVSANADHIHQIQTQLVTNAWESMHEHGGRIRLGISSCLAVDIPAEHRFPIGWQPQASVHACLLVADTGCGIAETDIEKLFDPFYSTKFTGRGLGLPVVLGIVQAHGGAVTVESRQGQGSSFRIFLPVATEGILASGPDKVQVLAGALADRPHALGKPLGLQPLQDALG